MHSGTIERAFTESSEFVDPMISPHDTTDDTKAAEERPARFGRECVCTLPVVKVENHRTAMRSTSRPASEQQSNKHISQALAAAAVAAQRRRQIEANAFADSVTMTTTTMHDQRTLTSGRECVVGKLNRSLP